MTMRRVILGLAIAVCVPATVCASGDTAPRWIVPIDSRTTDQWLSEGAGVVYGARDGRLVALDMRDGHVVWASHVATVTKSAVSGDAVAAPTASGVVFLRARDGAVVHRSALGSAPIVASAAAGFVSVVRTRTGVEARGWTFDGRPRWARSYRGAPFGTLLQLGGNAVGLVDAGSGNLLVIDGGNGNGVAATDGVDTLIGADGRYLWFNVLGGGVKGLDLDTNRTVALHGSVVRGAARVEHSVAVAVVDGRLVRLDLRTGTQVPLKVDGRWIGGPADGRIFIERSDGVYVRDLSPRGEQRRVARYAGQARLVAADRNIGMIAMHDGRIFVVDLPKARPLATIQTTCTAYEGFATSDSTTLVHCDKDRDSELVAFDRYASLRQ